MSEVSTKTLVRLTGLKSIERTGVLPDFEVAALVENGRVIAPALDLNQIQPASIDLRLGARLWRIPASFLPGLTQNVSDLIKKIGLQEIDLRKDHLLEPGAVYIVELQESLDLPGPISASANPKSSTGRLDVLTRVICDRAERFDSIPAGYSGPLFLEICPQTFPIIVRYGSRLAQIRFRVGDPRLDADQHRALQDSNTILRDADGASISKGIGEVIPLTVDLFGSPTCRTIAYRAKRHAGAIDVDKVGMLSVDQYWDRLEANPDRAMFLHPGEFYILASKETVSIPNGYTAEMPTYNSTFGVLINNQAGFIDPCFGLQNDQCNSSRLVLEVRCYITPFMITHGQLIATLILEKMRAHSNTPYGAGLSSNYQGQHLKLSKHFQAP